MDLLMKQMNKNEEDTEFINSNLTTKTIFDVWFLLQSAWRI